MQNDIARMIEGTACNAQEERDARTIAELRAENERLAREVATLLRRLSESVAIPALAIKITNGLVNGMPSPTRSPRSGPCPHDITQGGICWECGVNVLTEKDPYDEPESAEAAALAAAAQNQQTRE